MPDEPATTPPPENPALAPDARAQDMPPTETLKPNEKPVIKPPPAETPEPVVDSVPDEHPTPPSMEMPVLGSALPSVETSTPEVASTPTEVIPAPDLDQVPLENPFPTTPEVNINSNDTPPSGEFPWKLVAIITTVLAIISIAFVAFMVIQNSQLVQESASEADTTETPSNSNPAIEPPSPTPDPAAGWELYNNKTYKYTLKFPSDKFSYYFCDKSTGLVGEDFFALVPSEDFSSIEVPCEIRASLHTVIEIKVEEGNSASENLMKKDYIPSNWDIKSSTISVDNISGIKADYTYVGPPGELVGSHEFTEIRIFLGGNTYIFTNWKKENKETFDQILSTFKFLDEQ